MKGYLLSAAAGGCGGLASFTAKLVTDDNNFSLVVNNADIFWALSWLVKVIFLACTILLNGFMWTLFVESMQYLPASKSLVINTGSNILLSALIGHVLFYEVINLTWSLGASLIVVGISILVTGD